MAQLSYGWLEIRTARVKVPTKRCEVCKCRIPRRDPEDVCQPCRRRQDLILAGVLETCPHCYSSLGGVFVDGKCDGCGALACYA